MRTSILSRSAVAVATLAIGSVALAAVPATAATPSGITRDTIVTVLDGARDARANDTGYSEATQAAADKLAQAACGYTQTEGFYAHSVNVDLFKQGSADGGLVTVRLHDSNPGEGRSTHSYCSFGVVVSSDKDAVLSGKATLALVPRPVQEQPSTLRAAAADDSSTADLSGHAFVSASATRDETSYFSNYSEVTFTASGAASKTTATTDQRKIWDHKSKAEKKAAAVKYDKRIAKAKKAYSKALDQAGNNSAQKASAKKAYLAKRAETKVKYDYAVWNYRYVTSTKSSTRTTPFNLTATSTFANES